jgi:hypothetical protein
MRRSGWDRTAGLVGFAGLVMIIVFVWVPQARGPLMGAGILLVLAYFLARIAGRAGELPSSGSSRFERALRVSSPEEERPPDLEHFERTLGWRSYSPQEFHARVRPVLRRLLVNRLQSHRGIDAERHPEAARRQIDPELWRLLESQDAESAVVEGKANTIYIDRLLVKIERLR